MSTLYICIRDEWFTHIMYIEKNKIYLIKFKTLTLTLNWGEAQIKEETNLKKNKIGSKLTNAEDGADVKIKVFTGSSCLFEGSGQCQKNLSFLQFHSFFLCHINTLNIYISF